MADDDDKRMICQRCWLPVVWYGDGWRHHPGPGRTVPDPGHEIAAVSPSVIDPLIEAARRAARDL